MPPNKPPSILAERALQPPSTQWVAAHGKKNIEGPCILYSLFNLLILVDYQTRLPYQESITQRLHMARMNIGLGRG